MTSEIFSGAAIAHRSASAERRWADTFVRFALPLLVLIVYTNASDLAIRALSIPSILQPLIAIIAIAVWLFRSTLEPSEILFQPLTILLGAYCFLLFCSSLWASDVALADQRL